VEKGKEGRINGEKGKKNWEWMDGVSASDRRGGDKKDESRINFFERENSKGRTELSNISSFRPASHYFLPKR
jgi:hypothetical protein